MAPSYPYCKSCGSPSVAQILGRKSELHKPTYLQKVLGEGKYDFRILAFSETHFKFGVLFTKEGCLEQKEHHSFVPEIEIGV